MRSAGRLSLLALLPLPACGPPTPGADLAGDLAEAWIPPDGGAADLGSPGAASVLQHHKSPRRDGNYVEPALTRAAAATLHRDPAFAPAIQGPTYAQPLYLDGGAGRSLIVVATERNQVYGLDATTGAAVWSRALRAPVPRAQLPCGNIDPLGVTGTPIVDPATRTLYLDAMTTPDGGATKRHLLYALGADDGALRPGWPLDVEATVHAPVQFHSSVQNQRGALALLGGTLYVPYGGHWGDCGDYRGWVVGVPVAAPATAMGWATRVRRTGIWGPSGVASDGASLWVATGNSFGADTWMDGEAVIRFGPGPTFSGQPADYFAPTDWKALDDGDVDLGGTAPVLFDVAGATPSKLTIALGKNGKAYLLDREKLGGVGGQLAVLQAASNEIINAAAAYTTAQGSYVVFKGNGVGCPGNQGGDLTALRIVPGAPPRLAVAWCADQSGEGSPIATTTDGTADPIVWSVGSEGDRRLHGFDGDTGEVIFDGGGPGDAMESVRRFMTPIVARGRIYVAGDKQVYAFQP